MQKLRRAASCVILNWNSGLAGGGGSVLVIDVIICIRPWGHGTEVWILDGGGVSIG